MKLGESYTKELNSASRLTGARGLDRDIVQGFVSV